MDWLETHVDLSRAEIWALGSFALAVIATNAAWLGGWLVYRHTATPAVETCANEGRLVLALRAPIDAALAQWHLAFYRAALIAWLGALAALPDPLPKTMLPAMR